MAKYCKCRSKRSSGFMIQCDHCEEWFHGDCINLNEKQSNNIDKYFCDACQAATPGLGIVYKPGFHPPAPKQQQQPKTDKRSNSIHDQPLEELKQEKKVLEKAQSTSKQRTSNKAKQATSRTNNQSRRRDNQKSKTKSHNRKQCANPPCVFEARADSKYCSDDCGIAFNKLRYEQFFIPKWKNLEENPSMTTKLKRREIEQLDQDRKNIRELIKKLRLEKEELEANIKIIKQQATKQSKENTYSKKDNDDDEVDSDAEVEESSTGEAAQTFCISCGKIINISAAFRHWASCHKKLESNYQFTADGIVKLSCEEDENPKLYCHVQEKRDKKIVYCMYLESACPRHSNWNSDKDEVCGCPQTIMQKLVPDENNNYCLELKKDCKQHYHWDRFRLAQINMQRIQAFLRYDAIQDKIRIAQANYDDIYGGVVGIMLHDTIDHKEKKYESNNASPEDESEDFDVDMTNVY